jgi:hypothetical protein
MRTDKPLPTDTRSVRRASGFVLVGYADNGRERRSLEKLLD